MVALLQSQGERLKHSGKEYVWRDGGGQAQQDSPKNEPQRTQPKSEKRGGNPIRTSPPKKETAPDSTVAEILKDFAETEEQAHEPT